MNETVPGKRPSAVRIVLATAVLTLLITGGGVYLLGYLSPPSQTHELPSRQGDRKVAYWRAPMNPTEIYDKPGKSAMGMDLVPVYEDELDGRKDSAGPDTERKIAYWRAPMNPTEIYDKPGKSAMGMDLVPVFEDELVGGVEVTIDPVIQQNMGLRTATVRDEPLVHTIRTYGHITPDETRTGQVNLKAGGWIEALYVDFTGMYVEKGQVMFDIYAPQLLAAQEELLAAKRRFSGTSGEMGDVLLASARRRLRYFDIAESEIERIESSGIVQKTLSVRSPITGYVIEKNVEEGSYVREGTNLFRITDLSRVWVEAHIYEFELPWVAKDQPAEMSLTYLPGKVFRGRVAYVYPYLQPQTRDVVIRLEFDNPDLHLKPEMFADVRINSTANEHGTVVPSEAVIRSGERNIVFVQRENNKFAPRDVTLGLSLDGGKIQILTGLVPGETVVTSGQFLLDSESKLKEAVQKMLDARREKGSLKEVGGKTNDAFFEDMEEAEPEDLHQNAEAGKDFFKDLEQALE